MYKIYKGTEIKLNINILPIGNKHISECDFELKFYSNSKSIILRKEDLKEIDGDNYIAKIDTSNLGIGTLKCKVTVWVKDSDFEDGLRTEVTVIDTEIYIVED